ncbi:MAG: hypothetical protein RL376_260 [Verrucomicrobiota bacterium]|jgi:ElaB/YqjD/DUF883 family membrane-anchored ribosome-binding protein
MKSPNESSASSPKELLNDLQALVLEAEKMMGDSLTEHTADAVSALRTRFDAAQERVSHLYSCAKARAVAGAKCTDDAIRANPYQSLAIAAGAGLILGVLLGRRSK